MRPTSWHVEKLSIQIESLELSGDHFFLEGMVLIPENAVNALLREWGQPDLHLEIALTEELAALHAKWDGVMRVTVFFRLHPWEKGVLIEVDEVLFFDLVPLRGFLLGLLESTVLKFVDVPHLKYADRHYLFDLTSVLPPRVETGIEAIVLRKGEVAVKLSKKRKVEKQGE